MKIETNTQTWKSISAHCTDEIDRLRNALEGNASDADTARFRAEIKAFRSILALPDVLNAPPITYDGNFSNE